MIGARALIRTLAIVAAVLLAAHLAIALVHHRVQELPWLLRQLFDLDEENNFPTWYAQFLLLVTAACLWLYAQNERRVGRPGWRHWTVLAIGFLLLSVDEVAGVHETVNSMIVITWAIPGGLIALAIGLAFVPFLLRLPRRTALLFGAAGATYLAGAAGLEVLGNEMVRRGLRETLGYRLQNVAEEGLEMGGVILFLYALLALMRGARQQVRGAIGLQ